MSQINYAEKAQTQLDLLTVHQTAEAWNTSDRFVRRVIHERRIPFVKVGRHVRIRRTDVVAFIDNGTVPAVRHG